MHPALQALALASSIGRVAGADLLLAQRAAVVAEERDQGLFLELLSTQGVEDLADGVVEGQQHRRVQPARGILDVGDPGQRLFGGGQRIVGGVEGDIQQPRLLTRLLDEAGCFGCATGGQLAAERFDLIVSAQHVPVAGRIRQVAGVEVNGPEPGAEATPVGVILLPSAEVPLADRTGLVSHRPKPLAQGGQPRRQADLRLDRTVSLDAEALLVATRDQPGTTRCALRGRDIAWVQVIPAAAIESMCGVS